MNLITKYKFKEWLASIEIEGNRCIVRFAFIDIYNNVNIYTNCYNNSNYKFICNKYNNYFDYTIERINNIFNIFNYKVITKTKNI